ncbi:MULTISPECIES: response regulator transcription factor [Clostridium]|uniref:Stage 0 sporulation protein A homolog n=1 Tax=Clostridium botulinum (strain Eklund 17B / Type B) TaxID=935198 RepID=B2THI2_CLOBB|nr:MULTISPECIES: response regulator transcription factor [Clostridium]ACD25001.1 DNA-binding response regulator [Clostridium botulinum B str. Eklund 17B (NRP)]MBY6975050.1 response regulator transcription factor [Clostridium botulinum]MBY7000030.1 response regulator transcription factor [Clostridium botulinum]MCR1274803.1 response regulator transcription factor [Clostridium botulinum]NFD68603.1 response regulator transcription factor [Clostridium botulinum]
MFKIMIIEDNKTIREKLADLLVKYGYEVFLPKDFTTIIEDFNKSNPHLILLDINLPIFDGFHFCKEIRKYSNIPIIFVTSRDSNMDEIMSMTVGGDDFITKPYDSQILIARITAVLRRSYNNLSNDILEYKGVSLNLGKGNVTYQNKTIDLTKNEFKILNNLLQNKGSIVTRDDLMNYLWNDDVFLDDNTLTVNINRLRKKLEEINIHDFIETRRGLGYIIS